MRNKTHDKQHVSNAQSLGAGHSTMHNNLISIDKVCKLSQWVPLELDEQSKQTLQQLWLPMWSAGVHGRMPTADHNSRPPVDYIPCFVYSGIPWVFFIGNCYQITPPSHLSCNVSSSIAWLKKFNNFGCRIELSHSCMTTLDLIVQDWFAKNCNNLDGICSHILLTAHD